MDQSNIDVNSRHHLHNNIHNNSHNNGQGIVDNNIDDGSDNVTAVTGVNDVALVDNVSPLHRIPNVPTCGRIDKNIESIPSIIAINDIPDNSINFDNIPDVAVTRSIASTTNHNAITNVPAITKGATSLSVCVVLIDYIMAFIDRPYGFVDDTQDGPRPIVRIFGSCGNSGQRTCVYLHGAYPYFYIKPENVLDSTFQHKPTLLRYLPAMRRKLETLLAKARPRYHEDQLVRRVQQLVIVSRKSMYGFYPNEQFFVKISLRFPEDIATAVKISEEGSLGLPMQTFESHIPYLLQITSDYSIPPMGFLHLSNDVQIRRKKPETSMIFEEKGINEGIDPNFDESDTKKQFGEEDLRDLLDGISSQDLIWSQDPCRGQDSSTRNPTLSSNISLAGSSNVTSAASNISINAVASSNSKKDDSSVSPKQVDFVMWESTKFKLSTCELEYDANVQHILEVSPLAAVAPVGAASLSSKEAGQNPSDTGRFDSGFGAELWEEEKARREAEGLSAEHVATPPSTATCHRNIEIVEQEFIARMERLWLKGKALCEADIEEYNRFHSHESLNSPGVQDSESALESIDTYQTESEVTVKSLSNDTEAFVRLTQAPAFDVPLSTLLLTQQRADVSVVDNDKGIESWVLSQKRDLRMGLTKDLILSQKFNLVEGEDDVGEASNHIGFNPVDTSATIVLPTMSRTIELVPTITGLDARIIERKSSLGRSTMDGVLYGEQSSDDDSDEDSQTQQEITDILSCTQLEAQTNAKNELFRSEKPPRPKKISRDLLVDQVIVESNIVAEPVNPLFPGEEIGVISATEKSHLNSIAVIPSTETEPDSALPPPPLHSSMKRDFSDFIVPDIFDSVSSKLSKIEDDTIIVPAASTAIVAAKSTARTALTRERQLNIMTVFSKKPGRSANARQSHSSDGFFAPQADNTPECGSNGNIAMIPTSGTLVADAVSSGNVLTDQDNQKELRTVLIGGNSPTECQIVENSRRDTAQLGPSLSSRKSARTLKRQSSVRFELPPENVRNDHERDIAIGVTSQGNASSREGRVDPINSSGLSINQTGLDALASPSRFKTMSTPLKRISSTTGIGTQGSDENESPATKLKANFSNPVRAPGPVSPEFVMLEARLLNASYSESPSVTSWPPTDANNLLELSRNFTRSDSFNTTVSNSSDGSFTSPTGTGRAKIFNDRRRFKLQSEISDDELIGESWKLVPILPPPMPADLTPMGSFGLDSVINTPLHFSSIADCPDGFAKSTIGGIGVVIHHKDYLADFHGADEARSLLQRYAPPTKYPNQEKSHLKHRRGLKPLNNSRWLHPTYFPPRPVAIWAEATTLATSQIAFSNASVSSTSQIATPTPTNTKLLHMHASDSPAAEQIDRAGEPLTESIIQNLMRLQTVSLEILCSNRISDKTVLLPNPKHDPVECICWCLNDTFSDSISEKKSISCGVIVVATKTPSLMGTSATSSSPSNMRSIKRLLLASLASRHHSTGSGNARCRPSLATDPKTSNIEVVESELALFRLFIQMTRRIDPDFIVGYEIQRSSLGYLVDRGLVLGLNLLAELSCMPTEPPPRRNAFDTYAEEHESGIFITGRIVLNIWRRMREELKLKLSNNFSSVASELLRESVPVFTQAQLIQWFRKPSSMHLAVSYVLRLAILNISFMDKLDLIRRTSESARLYGIDFFSVISRGSQYRVEASLIKTAHRRGFLMMSPNKRSVASQAAMAVIPLVMEPRSKFYHDPVVVLDFQSLYPSMIIAYNLCYSTIMGSLKQGIGTGSEDDCSGYLGASAYPERFSALAAYSHSLSSVLGREPWSSPDATNSSKPFVAPNGSVFCTKSLRLGILPQMLKEILETRLMVKRAMKRYANRGAQYDVLSRVLDARQLSIKLLANVTYGYTSAGFSGRMPMAELADAVVQCGRSTLEHAISVVRNTAAWRADVVYGDTDSMFVLLRGRSKEEAVRLGHEIARTITALNPPDVVLKYEKVYYPCILATKKRYVGAMYETEDQKDWNFDAKGIEAIRRDQCPLVAKMQEKCLRILFECRDLSAVKEYCCRQFDKIQQGLDKVSLQDFIFCKEVKIGHYRGSPPPGAEVALNAMLRDPMTEPPYRWRVPYVIVCGTQTSRLMDLAVSPFEVLKRGSAYRINAIYYITKCVIPALDRMLSLCGVSSKDWFVAMRKRKLQVRHVVYEYGIEGPPSSIGASVTISVGSNRKLKQQSMDQFTMRGSCECCGNDSLTPVCTTCGNYYRRSLLRLQANLHSLTNEERLLGNQCTTCARTRQPAVYFTKDQLIGPECCHCMDCPILYDRCKIILRIENALHALDGLADMSQKFQW